MLEVGVFIAACHECAAAENTAQHTLSECIACSEPHRTVEETVGTDLSLPGVVRTMLGSEGTKKAMAFFCKYAMSQKEDAERAREANTHAYPLPQTGGWQEEPVCPCPSDTLKPV